MEKNTQISTRYLTHFTKKITNLKNIIDTGFRPSIPKNGEYPIYAEEYYELKVISEFMGYEKEQTNENQLFRMVCFCDIPLKISNKHRKTYGKYGISLKKEWAKEKRVCPVFYIFRDSKSHSITNSLNNQFKIIWDLYSSKEDRSNLSLLGKKISELNQLCKLYYDKERKYKYYDEREWRRIYSDKENIDKNYLEFDINDIELIIVTNKIEKKEINAMIKSKYGVDFKKNIKIRH